MESKKHILIFSHGFGVRKDDRDLLSDIAKSFPEVESILFDYNEIDEIHNTLTVFPLTKQAEMLTTVIEKARSLHPDAIIDLIAHSQGSLIVAVAKPKGIRKTIFIAPSLDTNIDRAIAMFKDRPGSVIDLEGTSRLARKDGSITIVPKEFWQERAMFEPISLYNELSSQTALMIINATRDDVLGNLDIEGLNENIPVVELSGNHQFSGDGREPLIKTIRACIL